MPQKKLDDWSATMLPPRSGQLSYTRFTVSISPLIRLHVSTRMRRSTNDTRSRLTSPDGLPITDFLPTFENVATSPQLMYEKSHPSAVGAGDGTGVGTGDGTTVGRGVGMMLGAGVGTGVGAGDGLALGKGLGTGVGWLDGTGDGLAVGSGDGAGDG